MAGAHSSRLVVHLDHPGDRMPNRLNRILLVVVAVISAVVIIGGLAYYLTSQQNPRTSPVPDLSTPVNEVGSSDTQDIALPQYSFKSLSYQSGIPRFAELRTIIPTRPRSGVITYTVETGDNLFTIAEKYGLKPETVLWGNYEVLRDNPQFLRPEQSLIILPTDGVYYQWKAGDTLRGVADFFKVEPELILDWPGNNLDLTEVSLETSAIPDGSWMIIPGGKRELKDWGPPAISRSNPAAAAYYGSGYCGEVYEGAIGIGAFIWPTPATYLSGYDYSPSIHPGIDIAGAEGNAIFASDSGVVVFAGWSEFGYGYLIVLDHGNGWQTAYAHLSSVGVYCGQSIGRGNVIGALGNTGNSSGPHLHFEMRSDIYGKVNPWDFVSP